MQSFGEYPADSEFVQTLLALGYHESERLRLGSNLRYLNDAFSENGLKRTQDLLAAMRRQSLDGFGLDRLFDDTQSQYEFTGDGYMLYGLELLDTLEKY